MTSDCSKTNSPCQPQRSQEIALTVTGMGHVPSFKNGKQLFVTSKKNREWMKRCIASFVFQSLSKCQTCADGTVTADSLQSLIASLPPDDNWKVIPVICVTAVKCEPGNEGAEIIITEII